MKNDTVAATKAEVMINVAVELAATSLSMPSLSQTGMRINAPPIARVAPTTPAQNPAKIKCSTLPAFTEIYSLVFTILLFSDMILFADWNDTQADTPAWIIRIENPQNPHGSIPMIESRLGPPLHREASAVKM